MIGGVGTTPTNNSFFLKSSSHPNALFDPLPPAGGGHRKASFGRVGSHSDIVKGTSQSSMMSSEMLAH